MKFNKTLCQNIIKDWQFYSVDYKAMKKALKESDPQDKTQNFLRIFEESKSKLQHFYSTKEAWAINYLATMEERVAVLRASKVSSSSLRRAESDDVETTAQSDYSSESLSASFVSGASDSEEEEDYDEARSFNFLDIGSSSRFSSGVTLSEASDSPQGKPNREGFEFLKEEYRRVGKCKHFQDYIYAKKSLDTFARELKLLMEFLELNRTGFGKILKKHDKVTGLSIRDEKLADLEVNHPYLHGEKIHELSKAVKKMLSEVSRLKPALPSGWERRKVYTIGCFDLFHRGHQNVLMSLREFGYFIVAGIHDDESYFKLKNKYTIENLETRMKNVKPFVDQLFVIPSTDPELYLKCMVSEHDIETGSCCYARGDDMLQFPGREWVESVMPVYFVPRTEDCSSSLLRVVYHADDPEVRKKAAFAKTQYDGKPLDENGQVIKA